MKKLVLATVLGVVSSTVALAEVRVFQAGQEPMVAQRAERGGWLGLLGVFQEQSSPLTQVADTLAANPQMFGVSIAASDLRISKAEMTDDGLALRFQQTQQGLVVDGAEVVALFNPSGALEVLNSSLTPVDSIDIKPALSQRKALKIALKALRLAKGELSDSEPVELRVVVKDGRSLLVWQFAVSSSEVAQAYRVQVVAGGAKKGSVLKTLSLSTEIANRSIYDASVTIVIPNPIYKGVKVLENGEKTMIGNRIDVTEAVNADQSILKTYNYFLKTFNRKSFDNKDAPLVAAVNASKYLKQADILGMQQNAAWMGPWKMFVFGAGGDMLGSFTESLDVVAHEYTHAVITSTSNLEYQSQSGGLNEHFADVFGVTVENAYEHPANPFLVGDKCLRGELAKKAPALRDMLHPQKSLGGQPAHMSEIDKEYGPDCQPSGDNDNCGVHTLSGIPNRAAALIIRGLGWEAASRIFYRVMTVRLRATSDFMDYRNQMVDECTAKRGRNACEVVRRAFADIGL